MVRGTKAGRMPAADPRAVQKVLPWLASPVREMVELQVMTGARPSELCRMTVGEVLRDGRVDVPGVGLVDLAAEKVWVYAPEEHKTSERGKDRWILFGPKAQALLDPFLTGRKPGEFVFAKSGKRFSGETYRHAIERACNRAGVTPWTPYGLRRLAARQIDADHGREATAAALGHSNLDTSAIYTGRNFAAAVRVAVALG